MNSLYFYAIYLISFIVFLNKRSKTIMHLFQQEEYYNLRFLQYISKKFRFIDKRLSAILLLLSASIFLTKNTAVHFILASMALLMSAYTHIDPRKKAKKPLVITQRVKRIFTVFYGIYVLVITLIAYGSFTLKTPLYNYLGTIILVQLVPFIIVLANLCLNPLESRVRKGFLLEAKGKIAELKPTVIGITGSYGKTSTKHILAHIMSSALPTLFTPGSVNTEMGITRVIREKLKPEHKYFVVEMGAYKPGSIQNRCELTPPSYGIITSIGNAHYERFKNEDNVAKTKFELAENVFKNKQGKLIINVDAVQKKYINKYCKKYQDQLIKVSRDKKLGDYIISKEKITKDGIQFDLKIEKKSYKIKAPLYGKHQITNVALCFALAYNIGISPESILASLQSSSQARHRLEVSKTPTGHILIDDAYNSNPTGFSSALGTLKLLKQKGGRTILVTPGMAELGELHNEKHLEIGKLAGDFVDIMLVVIPQRVPTLIEGFEKKAKSSQKVIKVDTFAQAKEWLDKNITSKDTVLYENDLPDLYETKVKI